MLPDLTRRNIPFYVLAFNLGFDCCSRKRSRTSGQNHNAEIGSNGFTQSLTQDLKAGDKGADMSPMSFRNVS